MAAKAHGWDRTICVFNRASGKLEDLPFDIRKRRVLSYELRPEEEKAVARATLVKALTDGIKAILHRPRQEQEEAAQRLVSQLGSELIDVLILGDELDERFVNPWLESLQSSFLSAAESLREMAATETAADEGLSPAMNDLADSLDAAGSAPILINGPDIEGLARTALEEARALKATHIDGLPLPEASLKAVREDIGATQRQLEQLAARAQAMADDARFDDVQTAASTLGRRLLRVSYYNLDRIRPGLAAELQRIGHDLHLLETVELMGDGGATERAALARVAAGAAALSALAADLGPARRR